MTRLLTHRALETTLRVRVVGCRTRSQNCPIFRNYAFWPSSSTKLPGLTPLHYAVQERRSDIMRTGSWS